MDMAATIDMESKTAALFLFNRNLEKPQDVEVIWRDATPSAVKQFLTITGPDLKAGNTFADPKRVTPQVLENPKAGARMTLQLPARSYSVYRLLCNEGSWQAAPCTARLCSWRRHPHGDGRTLPRTADWGEDS